MTGDAIVTPWDGGKKPPILGAGTLTPVNTAEWSMEAQGFVIGRAVPSTDAVRMCAPGLQDLDVRTWYYNDHEKLNQLTLTEFVAALRTRWLRTDWASAVKSQLLRCRQGANDDLPTWLEKVERLNSILKGTPTHLDDNALRSIVTANVNNEFRPIAEHDNLTSVKDYKDWRSKLLDADDERLVRMREVLRWAQRVDTTIKPNRNASSANRARGRAHFVVRACGCAGCPAPSSKAD